MRWRIRRIVNGLSVQSTERSVSSRPNKRVNLTAGSSVALVAVKFSGGGRLPLALGKQ